MNINRSRLSSSIGAPMRVLSVATLFLAILVTSSPAYATSQWSRKYEVACSVCHSAFPRLNYFGERFLRNGFQWPDLEPDGDIEGKTEVGPDAFVDQLGNMIGFRLNLDAVRVRANKAVVGGELKTQANFGSPNWGQLFVAGSLFKNVSVFIENEFEGDAFKFTWFHFGFHNLGSKAINFQVGNLSPLEFASYPNRLRIMAPVKGDVFGVKTTGGAQAADNLTISGFRPGIQYYGHGGPVVWWAGVTPGKGTADVNDDRHYWGGIKFEIPADDSDFQGSSVSVWTYQGTDGTPDPAAVGADIDNDFDRVSLQGNLRWTNLDIQARGWTLVTTTGISVLGRRPRSTSLVSRSSAPGRKGSGIRRWPTTRSIRTTHPCRSLRLRKGSMRESSSHFHWHSIRGKTGESVHTEELTSSARIRRPIRSRRTTSLSTSARCSRPGARVDKVPDHSAFTAGIRRTLAHEEILLGWDKTRSRVLTDRRFKKENRLRRAAPREEATRHEAC